MENLKADIFRHAFFISLCSLCLCGESSYFPKKAL
jgi:hypothetical protein